MQDTMILWADDEIDLLKPHILFLNEKGYQVKTVTNGADAIDLIKSNYFDLVFLDENMPGISGLDALVRIKEKKPSVPIVMILIMPLCCGRLQRLFSSLLIPKAKP